MLDLTDAETLQALGVEPDELVRDDLQLTREIGEAAHEHRFQAIRSASVTGVADVVAILPENLAGAVLAAELVQGWTISSPQPGSTRLRPAHGLAALATVAAAHG